MLSIIEINQRHEIAALERKIRTDEPFDPKVIADVREILKEVKTQGDKALLDFTAKYDGVNLSIADLHINRKEMEEAISHLDDEFFHVLVNARDNIQAFHQNQHYKPFQITDVTGSRLGQRVVPLDTVGVYVPGGRMAYPSTVLMGIIPAKVAGVKRIIMTTPPHKSAKIPDVTLAAAYLAGADSIFQVGGAQAIAAMAYGTETIPRVDKIIGPGNVYVSAAKSQCYGKVGLDMLAGPTEILVLADFSANAEYVAVDIISQAEHDPQGKVFLISPNDKIIKDVNKFLAIHIEDISRKDIIERVLKNNGYAIKVPSLEMGIAVANTLAPEHMQIMTQEPQRVLKEVKAAGTVFLGPYTPEVIGDYMAGPSHILPTAGSARFFSGLSTYDFLKLINFVEMTKNGFLSLASQTKVMADKEELEGHARSIELRLKKE